MPQSSSSTDCLILGAGVVGLSIADQLLQQGLSVTLVDRGRPGREASWAGAGMLPPGSAFSDHPALEKLARISHPLQASLSDRIREQTGLDDGYWRCGGLYLAPHQEASDKLEAMVKRWKPLGIGSERANSERVAELLPKAKQGITAFADRFSSYYLPEEVQIRNPRLLKGLAQLCQQAGARFITDCEIVDINEDSSAVQVTTNAGEKLTAGRVVVATGSWSTPLLSKFTRISVKPMKGQMALFEHPAGVNLLATHIHAGPNYLVPRRDGRIIAGSTVEDAGFDKSTNAGGLAEVLKFVSDCGLGHLRLTQTWAGLRPASSDGMPLIGPATGAERVFFATGHFRAGLQFAPATAVLIREMMMGQPSSMDTTPFRVNR